MLPPCEIRNIYTSPNSDHAILSRSDRTGPTDEHSKLNYQAAEKGVWREVSVISRAYALFRTTIQNKIFLLYTKNNQHACVTVEQKSLHRTLCRPVTYARS